MYLLINNNMYNMCSISHSFLHIYNWKLKIGDLKLKLVVWWTLDYLNIKGVSEIHRKTLIYCLWGQNKQYMAYLTPFSVCLCVRVFYITLEPLEVPTSNLIRVSSTKRTYISHSITFLIYTISKWWPWKSFKAQYVKNHEI